MPDPQAPDRQEVKAPYPGLRSFEPHEAEIFFGREAHTDRLLEILQRERFLAVLGPSGAGKSSLVRAGLLPGLAAGWLGGASEWRIAILRPGERPYQRLARELARSGALGPCEDALAQLLGIEAELRRGPLGLVHLLADARRGKAAARPFQLLVLVDQFEEIFRYAEAGGAAVDESAAFVDLLLASRAEPDAGVYVALTMRTDFLGYCVRFLDLPEAINRAQYLTPRLNRSELERAIAGPARVFGGDVAPELANQLINALGDDFDQLPLLQHALARMWLAASSRPATPPRLIPANLATPDGLQGVLSAHAEDVFNTLSLDDQALAETLFRAITLRESPGPDARGTRRPQKLGEIAAVAGRDAADLEEVVLAFAAEGVNFLHHGEPLGPESVIDISHEALIRHWVSLRIWAQDEARRAAELRRWQDRAVLWAQGGELLTGADLERAIEWRDGDGGRPPTPQWAARYLDAKGEVGFGETLSFIAASEAAETDRQERETLRIKAQEQLERSAFEARAEAAEARAEAAEVSAEADRVMAETAARVWDAKRSRLFLLVALLGTALALVLAGGAVTLLVKEKDTAQQSSARQLANEATFLSAAEPDRAQLLAVAAFESRALPASEVVVRQEYLLSTGLLRTLRGHEGRVASAVFSPDGRTLLTAGDDRTARLWDMASGRLLQTLRGHQGAVVAAVFSPDGRTVLTTSWDQTARLWDAASGQPLQILREPQDMVVSAVFSPDGRTVLTAGADKTARLWDADSGRPLRTLRGHQDRIVVAVFSPDGRTVLTASLDGTARLWDAATGEPLRSLSGHQGRIYGAVFSPDGRTVLTAGADQTARLWDAATGWSRSILHIYEGAVAGAVFSPDGKTVLTTGGDKTIRLWDAATGVPLQRLGVLEENAVSALFSPDGRSILVDSGKTASLWDAASGQLLQTLRGHQGEVLSAVFSPNGRTLLTAGADQTARLWDAAAGRPLHTLRGHEEALDGAVFSPDGRTLLTAGADRTARLWDSATGRPLQILRGHEGSVVSAVFSPDGRTVLTASSDRSAQLWRAANGHALHTLSGHGEALVGAVFSPDGRTVLTASSDRTARLWDAATGRLLRTLRGHAQTIYGAVFSPNGRTVLTASLDGTARLWDEASGRSLPILRGHEGAVFSAAFSPDGRTVLTASADQTAREWETDTGRPLQSLRGHDGAVTGAVFSPDGRTVLTTGLDGTARLWDAATGRPLQTLSGHEGLIASAVFNPDGRSVLTAGDDRTARLWPCPVCRPTRELAQEILRRVGRSLTPEERAEAGLP